MIRFESHFPKRFILLLIFLFLTSDGVAIAAFEERLYSTRAAALGGAYAALMNNHSAIFGNPSSLGFNDNRRLNILYGRSFGLKELANSGISVPFNFEFGNIEIGLSRFGFSLYHEDIVSIGVGKRILNNAAVGLALRYLSTGISGYGSAATIGVDIGFSMKINPKLNLGVSAKNVNAPKLSKSEDSLARSLRVGASFAIEDNVSLIAEYHTEENQIAVYRIGSEIEILNDQYLRFGITSNPSSFSMGFGIKLNRIDLNYSFNSHQYLDASQFFSLGYIF